VPLEGPGLCSVGADATLLFERPRQRELELEPQARSDSKRNCAGILPACDCFESRRFHFGCLHSMEKRKLRVTSAPSNIAHAFGNLLKAVPSGKVSAQ